MGQAQAGVMIYGTRKARLMKPNCLRLTASLVFVCNLSLLADDTPVFSGPQVGEKLTSFETVGVYGKYRDKTLDLIEMSGGKPTMLLFVHNVTRPAGDLSRVLIHYGEMRADDGLFSALVLLTDDLTKMEGFMGRTQWWSAGSPVGLSVDGAEGPGPYGLNRNVTMTILIAHKNRITANFALVQPSVTEVPKILDAVHKHIGGQAPTLAETHFLQGPSRLGVTTKDIGLRRRICNVLHSHADEDARQKAAATLDQYVASDKELQSELAKSSEFILRHRYGGRNAIIKAAPETRELFEAWVKNAPTQN